jgi:hypothetical protein
MIDFYLRFPNQAAFKAISRGIYEEMAQTTLPNDKDTPRQGLSATGTHWFVDEIGTFYEPTGETQPDGLGGERPVMQARSGYHALLRWNGGDAEPPSNIPGMEIVWRSDAKDAEGNPIPRPEWWTRVIA